MPLIDSSPLWPRDQVSDRGCGTMPLSESCTPDAVGNATLRWCNTTKMNTIPLRPTRPGSLEIQSCLLKGCERNALDKSQRT